MRTPTWAGLTPIPNWGSTSWPWKTTTPPSGWSSGDAVAHYSRGACHAQLGNLAGAVSDFDAAIRLAPDNADPWYNRGLTYAEMGEPLRAVEDLSRAIELEPGLAEARYNRGMVYRDLGEIWTGPSTTINAAIELEPNYGLARYARGITKLNLGEFDSDAPGDFDTVMPAWTPTTPARCGAGASRWATWAVTPPR